MLRYMIIYYAVACYLVSYESREIGRSAACGVFCLPARETPWIQINRRAYKQMLRLDSSETQGGRAAQYNIV